MTPDEIRAARQALGMAGDDRFTWVAAAMALQWPYARRDLFGVAA